MTRSSSGDVPAKSLVYRVAARPLGVTLLLLLIPFVAMQATDEVNWTFFDFVVMGALLAGTGMLYELARIRGGSTAYRAGAGIALASSLLVVWVNLAVGIVGEPDNPANAMYFGVLLVGAVGAAVSRFSAEGMARALLMAAAAQLAVAIVTFSLRLGPPAPAQILVLNGSFAVVLAGCAMLFRHAARNQTRAATP